MVSKRPKPMIRYSLAQLPPRTFWKIEVSLPRTAAGSFSENLHALVKERGGASFYYPNVEKSQTICRYEWHRKFEGKKYGLRIGIVVNITNNDISELEAYVTRSEIFDDMTAKLESIPEDVVASIQEEVIRTLEEVEKRTEPSNVSDFLPVFHIEVPYTFGFSQKFLTSDGRVTILPTRIIKDRNKRISAVIVRSEAGSKEVAKANAFNDLTIVCALFTIANAQRFETTTLEWSRYRQPIQFLSDFEDMVEDRLYPRRKNWPQSENMKPFVSKRCEWVWSAYNKITQEEQTVFLPALFAYYASITGKKNLSTLSVVGFTASLGALAKPYHEKCSGTLSCNICGGLTFKHDIIGEVKAISKMIIEVCGIEDQAKRSELKEMLHRVYGKQRSAFVHGAQFRHEEYGQGPGLPAQMPTNDAPVRELFEYSQDLMSLSSITRRTLLQWLEHRSGVTLDLESFFINPDKITVKLKESIHVTFPEPAVIGFAKSAPNRKEWEA